MPFDFDKLSNDEKHDILNPPRLRGTDMEAWYRWPTGKPVDFPTEHATNSHWIMGSRHRLDHFRSTAELPSTCDVLIIGSGMTGSSAAYHLTKADPRLRIVVVDARGFCSGATGRNGGHCFRPEGWDMRAEVARQGAEKALAVRRNHIVQRDLIQATIDQLGVREKVDCTFTGGVHIFASQTERDSHIADLALCEELGFEHESQLLGPEEMGKVLECRNEFGGLYTKRSGSFWPRKFCAEIMETAISQGDVNLQTNTCVTSIQEDSNSETRWIANTKRGQIRARTIIHATNGYAGSLLPELMGTPEEIIPMLCMVIAARPRPTPESSGTWPVNILASHGYHWLVQMPKRDHDTRENLVIYGLHGEGPSTDDSKLLENHHEALDEQRRYLAYSFPQKFSVVDDEGMIPGDSVESAWTGVIGLTKSDDVVLGPVKAKRGQFTAVGFNGAGMTKCWGSGMVVADMARWELGASKEAGSQQWQAPDWYPKHWLKNLEGLHR